MKLKEIFWLIGTTIFALIVIYLIFDFDSLSPDSTVDVNIHDTYFILPSSYFVVLILILIFFGVYLIRMLSRNFKNKSANVIFLIANVLLVLKMTQTIYILSALTQSTENGMEMGGGLLAYSNALIVILVFLLILLGFSAIKTGLNYKKSE